MGANRSAPKTEKIISFFFFSLFKKIASKKSSLNSSKCARQDKTRQEA